MKKLVLLLSLFGLQAHASDLIVDCNATEIYMDNYFEESFSVDEYPQVWISYDKAYFGSARYKSEGYGRFR